MTITVLNAVYGTTKNGFDVTETCQGLVNDGNDDIAVNNDTFGDPDKGNKKSFGILYKSPQLNNGAPIALGCIEGTVLDLVPVPPTAHTSPQNPLAPTGNVTVRSAVYGTGKNGNDVTAICQALVNQGNYTIPVNNAVLGPDPDAGPHKSFSIEYTLNGKTYAFACQEGTNLVLPV
ncbi:hypothetical protein FBZ89_118113 [Nitrospirillum amazonense]|uniref:Uncharacterized protein n=1 Tax=Nitrospirillum amazonense TaxID=28077 RepID=A0A560EXE1_9PROT|nr:hypothetical protein [Nitrospirillum amazonense]TWB14060.1 hypothetical protein FBZ89_118113 [Nitrospirillum amazonense]